MAKRRVSGIARGVSIAVLRLDPPASFVVVVTLDDAGSPHFSLYSLMHLYPVDETRLLISVAKSSGTYARLSAGCRAWIVALLPPNAYYLEALVEGLYTLRHVDDSAVELGEAGVMLSVHFTEVDESGDAPLTRAPGFEVGKVAPAYTDVRRALESLAASFKSAQS